MAEWHVRTPQRGAGQRAGGPSKHDLLALADSLRDEVNPLGIRVLTVFLDATTISARERSDSEAAHRDDPNAFLQPEDVAQLVRYALAMPRDAEVTVLHIRPAMPHRSV